MRPDFLDVVHGQFLTYNLYTFIIGKIYGDVKHHILHNHCGL